MLYIHSTAHIMLNVKKLASVILMYGRKLDGEEPEMVALLCGADLGLDNTDLTDCVGDLLPANDPPLWRLAFLTLPPMLTVSP